MRNLALVTMALSLIGSGAAFASNPASGAANAAPVPPALSEWNAPATPDADGTEWKPLFLSYKPNHEFGRPSGTWVYPGDGNPEWKPLFAGYKPTTSTGHPPGML